MRFAGPTNQSNHFEYFDLYLEELLLRRQRRTTRSGLTEEAVAKARRHREKEMRHREKDMAGLTNGQSSAKEDVRVLHLEAHRMRRELSFYMSTTDVGDAEM